ADVAMRWTRLVTCVVALMAALAPAAAAEVVHLPDGHFLGVTPHRGTPASNLPGAVARSAAALAPNSDTGALSYHAGPVVHSSAPYLIFWTPSGETIASSRRLLLTRYFTDVAADSGGASVVYGVGRQYTDSSGFANDS